MASSSKRIGFFCGEDKITLVEFEKNAPLKVLSTSLGPKTNIASPFSSNFSEEIQLSANLQKILQDNRISGGSFYVSLPVKEIILRSFTIHFVKQEDLPNAIKFEAKKYLPIDIQDLNFVYYKVPFTENNIKRYQIIFFAVRKETMDRYDRIFKQANATVTYCEPSMVSLSKVLLFKKEITPTDHVAFLTLDNNIGRLCFIDQGIPQFIREFIISSPNPLDESKDTVENLNLKIVNEVANSFDFYLRQFNGDKIEQMLVSAETMDQDLFNVIEAEIKIKLRKVSSIVTLGTDGPSNDLSAIFAMGACIDSPLPALSDFNFIAEKQPKSKMSVDFTEIIKSYKEIIFVFFICVIALIGVYVFFQVQLKVDQQQYNQMASKAGAFSNVTVDTIQTQTQQDTSTLTAYKNIRTKSDFAIILLRAASHFPPGAMLKELSVKYDQPDSNNGHIVIYMSGEVYEEDPNEELKTVNQIFSDFKNDKKLAQYIKNVTISLNLEESNGRQVMGFVINCI